MKVKIEDITIRHDLRPGDFGAAVELMGLMLFEEFQYGCEFEVYMAESLGEFYRQYKPEIDRSWICEHNGKLIGYLSLQHRENNTAQLRFFVLEKAYRGIGLGKKLMEMFMAYYHDCGYQAAYLWTTEDLQVAAGLYSRYGFEITEELSSFEAFGRPVLEQRYDLTTNR